jgi:nitrite reductase/ring-hydroxylating ferredoxin subunit
MANDVRKGCSDCPGSSLDRRQVLALAGAATGLVVLGGVVSGCNAMGDPPTGPEGAGNVSALPVGSLLVMSNVVVARDANGVYGMSAVCTHAGCLLDDGAQTIAAGLNCPCHGSTFDGNGAVTQGPAQTPLQHYAVTIAADGGLTVDGSMPVSADTRTPTS